MKTKWIVMGGLVALVAGSLFVTEGSPKKLTPTEIFMRRKLGYSQKVLEGIALENYSMVITNGTHLWLMTQSNVWVTLKNSDYAAKSDQYRLDVIAMVDAARASNTPALLTTYNKVTADCVDCHQTFRREQHVIQLNSKKP